MKRICSFKIRTLSLPLILFFFCPAASRGAALLKTTKGYRLSILPAMGAEPVEREAPPKAKGKVRVKTLRETVYGTKKRP